VIVVANAGPLIALARSGHLELLRLLYGEIHIPPSVRDEVVAAGQECPGAVEVSAANWIHVVKVHDTVAVQLLRDRSGVGESEAIVLAMELNADLLLDEARGRRVAEGRGLNKTGMVGTLIMAKKRGLISAVRPLLDRLRATGFRMNDELYQTGCRRQARLAVHYKDIVAGEFRADFLVDGKVVVELKALKVLTDGDEAQLLHYLKGTGYRVGLLLNFGGPSLEYKRRVV
jgi:GxxExxY protein